MSMRLLKILGIIVASGILGIAAVTLISLLPVNESFSSIIAGARNVPVTDRSGIPLAVTYQAQWNRDDYRALYDIPPLLIDAFIYAEDRNFYAHSGVDWNARAAALWQNMRSRRIVRGASTITEQVVRLINPRPRSPYAKWLEGWEAMLLERKADKNSILEFYINQMPYAAGRRGAEQAARYYFDRDLNTLSPREMLALAVLARAPSAYDLYRHPGKIDPAITRLADTLLLTWRIDSSTRADIDMQTLTLRKATLPVDARHFARHIKLSGHAGQVRTTLDAALQTHVQGLLDSRIKRLAAKKVSNGGAIVIDHQTGDILAWAVAGAGHPDTPGGEIDTITSPRQPGSTLKPFLYATALEKGWTAASILNDMPVAEAVGAGLHRFRNYSNTHYGPVTLRESLGNSLNIPAILTINYVGVANFLDRLHALGFESLRQDADIYDEGLALGNGEVTLLELARAYSALANRGIYRPLRTIMDDTQPVPNKRVFEETTASIITDILSDPSARALEFGSDSVLNLPVRTAAKTGTSTDYRDAWAAGFNARYTVAVWFGNLDRTPMKEVTGSTGPALVLRSIFQSLNAGRETHPLYLSPALIARDVCTRPADADGKCPMRTEFFAQDKIDAQTPSPSATPKKLELVRPTRGLMIAYDPRIPQEHQKFRFEVSGLPENTKPEWILNGKSLGITNTPYFLWPVERGAQTLELVIHENGKAQTRPLQPITFTVK